MNENLGRAKVNKLQMEIKRMIPEREFQKTCDKLFSEYLESVVQSVGGSSKEMSESKNKFVLSKAKKPALTHMVNTLTIQQFALESEEFKKELERIDKMGVQALKTEAKNKNITVSKSENKIHLS